MTQTLSNVVKEHAGDIYAQTGDMAKAIEFWQKAIDGGNDSATLEKEVKLKEIRRRMKKTKIITS